MMSEIVHILIIYRRGHRHFAYVPQECLGTYSFARPLGCRAGKIE